jgi:hypothetical protein
MTNAVVGATVTEVRSVSNLEQGRGFGLGDRYTDNNGMEYIWVQLGAGGATPQFVLSIKADNSAIMATTTLGLRGERIGVYMGDTAGVATDYCWAMIYGTTNVQTAVASANVAMQLSATAGTIDPTATTGTKLINNLNLTAARVSTTGLAPAILTYPTVGITNP